MKKATLYRPVEKGFTMVEIVIVMAVMSLLVIGAVSSWTAYLDNAYQNSTEAKLEQTKRAMLDYVMVNYHMPCPDTDNDGQENRVDNKACSASTGTVPFDDIGRSLGNTSDEFGNVFLYGVNTGVNSVSTMKLNDYNGTVSETEEIEGTSEASYFANQAVVSELNADLALPAIALDIELPLFGLDTPVTAAHSPSSTSYTVCKRSTTASQCASTNSSDFEVQSIPAVLVALNENGAGVGLDSCNSMSRSAQETENCDGDLFLMRQTFNDSTYDDQIVTISAYEIKQQVLDRISGLGLKDLSYEDYDVIYLKNVTSANDINISTDSNNKYYIGANNDGDDGNLETNAVFKGGDDELYMEGNVTSAGDLKMGEGNDLFTVEGDLEGSVTLGSVNVNGEDSDTALVEGSIVSGGSLETGDKSDTVTVVNDVAGTIDLGSDNDTIRISGVIQSSGEVTTGSNNEKDLDVDIMIFNGTAINGKVNMGDDNDTLEIDLQKDDGTINFSIGSSAVIDGGPGSNTIKFVGVSAKSELPQSVQDAIDNSSTVKNFGFEYEVTQ